MSTNSVIFGLFWAILGGLGLFRGSSGLILACFRSILLIFWGPSLLLDYFEHISGQFREPNPVFSLFQGLKPAFGPLRQCSKLVKIMLRPQDGSLSKVIGPHQKQSAHTFLYKVPKSVKTDILLCFTKMAISPLIMVRFEKFKIWHTQENKPVLQDGLDPIFVRPDVFLSASGRRTGIIWNTDYGTI